MITGLDRMRSCYAGMLNKTLPFMSFDEWLEDAKVDDCPKSYGLKDSDCATYGCYACWDKALKEEVKE